MAVNLQIPKESNIPILNINIEGLKKHSFLLMFLQEPGLGPNERKLRSWLLHTLLTAATHYNKARELVSAQNSADSQRDGGTIFHILDASEHVEGCVLALYRAYMALRRMESGGMLSSPLVHTPDAFAQLSAIRNQFEHMHGQIVSSEIGKGPILMAFADDGESIAFRSLKLSTTELHALISQAYLAVASLYPTFDVNSIPQSSGPTRISISGTMTVIDGATGRKDVIE